MSRSFVKGVVCLSLLGGAVGCETIDTQGILNALSKRESGVSLSSVEAGLREALNVGTERTVTQLSAAGGYTGNPRLAIPFPEELHKVKSKLKMLGFESVVHAFEDKMGGAAEQAASLAAPVFADAVANMNFADVKKVFNGGETAATEYLKSATSASLKSIYMPIVKDKMEEVGAVGAYNKLVKSYNQLPLVRKVNFNIEEYVTGKALDGLFIVLADEEKKIRKDPVARSTELLKKVFSMKRVD